MHSNDGDSVRPRWKLCPSHRELLDKALMTAQKQLIVTPQMRSAIREICAARQKLAQEHEDSLIAFKLALVDSATNARIRPSPQRNDLLARLVSIYIEEYYSSVTTSPTGSRQEARGFASDS
jgi:hypothetical protein